MKMAMPIWKGRVSPVFDVAGRLAIWDVRSMTDVKRDEVSMGLDPVEKTKRLSDLGVSVLVCGAISQPLALMIEQTGIQVIANICGVADQIAEAYIAGRLVEPDYLMPGCCGRGRRFRGCRRGYRKAIDKEGNRG